MGADVLATKGARASATIIFTMLNWNNSVPALERLTYGSQKIGLICDWNLWQRSSNIGLNKSHRNLLKSWAKKNGTHMFRRNRNHTNVHYCLNIFNTLRHKTDVTPLLMHWRYRSLALSYRYVFCQDLKKKSCMHKNLQVIYSNTVKKYIF